ncbi:HAMP domain-containing protein [Desulfallas sp. Bu1-1]|uniref:sensor histidine kinase n=1 Tax=Desulfallas sp. Bu1-1 TaxID=2787620 RepID=UPI00189D4293|nr:ATP-binding protein [Desulfallas sp. Bu1-1]MBF7082569.1 HAMP domain-containing protein [Desulfallas sp. Bu1-1]
MRSKQLAYYLTRLKEIFDSSVYIKILIFMLLTTLLPIIFFSLFSVFEAMNLINKTTLESKKYIMQNILPLQEDNILSQAKITELQIYEIECAVQILQERAEDILNHLNDYTYPNTKTIITKDNLGYLSSSPLYYQGYEISNFFISNTTKPTADLMEKIYKLKHLDPLLRSAVLNNKNIVLAYVLLAENALRVYPKLDYAFLINKKLWPADLNFQEYEFYYSADPKHNPGKKVTWTHIYNDITTQGLIITCNAPLYSKNGSFIGVVGVDVKLEAIVNNILNIKFSQPNAYAALVTNTGEIIYSNHKLPDYSNELAINVLPKEIHRLIKTSYSGYKFIEINQKKYLVLYSSPAHWKLIYVIPEAEIFLPFQLNVKKLINDSIVSILKHFLAFFIVLILFSIGLSILFSNKISKPIKKLTEGAKAISKGEFIKIPVKSNDEIALLSRTFNDMSQKLYETIQRLKQKALEKEKLNRELTELNQLLDIKVKKRTIELTKMNRQLEQTIKKLSKTEQSRKELLTNVSHELRTPLMIIQGYVETIKDSLPMDQAEMEQCLKKIYTKCLQMERLISDLFILSQLESGQALNFKFVKLAEMLNQYFEEVSILFEKKNIRFSYDLPKDLPLVFIDPDRIVQVFNNLIHNALKYTPESGLITVKITQLDDFLQISIIDTGIGIPQPDLPHIFNRFYKGSNYKEGSGLGLAISKAIIEAHGGQITVDSIQGKGTKFTFIIPVQK